MAKVAEERIRAFQPAKINVTPPVAIHVAQSHTGTVFQNPILSDQNVREVVGKSNARLLSGQLGEPGLPGRWQCQLDKSEPRAALPVEIFIQTEQG